MYDCVEFDDYPGNIGLDTFQHQQLLPRFGLRKIVNIDFT